MKHTDPKDLQTTDAPILVRLRWALGTMEKEGWSKSVGVKRQAWEAVADALDELRFAGEEDWSVAR